MKKLNNGKILFILIIFIIGSATALIFNHSDSEIPPTPAFNRINNTSGDDVTANNYRSSLDLIAGSGIVITGNNSTKAITVTATATNGTGENNTASNIGTGVGIFQSKLGIDLRFHSLIAGANMTIIDIGNEIMLNASGITPRETLVNQIDDEKILSTIGTIFTDVYTSANSHGHATLIDTAGKSTVRLIIIWQYGGTDTGTQTCQIVDDDNGANILITSSSLSTGINDSGDVSIPAGLANTIKNYKMQCKSTVGTDSPAIFAFRVYLK